MHGLSDINWKLILFNNHRVQQPTSNPSKVNYQSPVEEKISLFRELFRRREDVYPKRWDAKNNNSGYSPVCSNEWNPAYCDKPRVKCNKCQNRLYVSLTDKVIYDHIAGKQTIGVYPLLPGDLYWFLAVDFDGTEWIDDVSAFLETCHVLQVPAPLERSRSGNGGKRHHINNSLCHCDNVCPCRPIEVTLSYQET